VSHVWTITGGSPDPTTTPTPPVTPDPAANTLPALSLPAGTEVPADDRPYDGVNNLAGDDGIVRLGPVADPSGSGRTVDLHRIVRSDPQSWGGHRSEILWSEPRLEPGHDFWMAFAVQQKPGEEVLPTDGYDDMLVFQTHCAAQGDTYPDISLVVSGQSGRIKWYSSYNASGEIDGNGWLSAEDETQLHAESMPTPGSWWRYVVHYRPGYLAEHVPKFEVWRAKSGSAYEKLFSHTGMNTYNTSATGAGASYPRIGLYKWSDVWRLLLSRPLGASPERTLASGCTAARWRYAPRSCEARCGSTEQW
jgi:hypothetical protein